MLTLHPVEGVNPRLTYCYKCKKDTDEIYLLGNINTLFSCCNCNTQHVGKPKNRKCHNCGTRFSTTWARRELKTGERLPSTSPCDDCQQLSKKLKDVVENGGVYFECSSCKSTGVLIPESEIAKTVREYSGIEAPDPVGYVTDSCPLCKEKDNATECSY